MYHTVDFLYRDLFHFQAFGFPISSFFLFWNTKIQPSILNSKTVLLQKPHQHHIKKETKIRNMACKMKWKPSGSQCTDKYSVDKSQHQDRYLKHQNPIRGKKSCPGGKWDDKIEHQGTWSNWSKMELKRTSSNSIRRNHHLPWTWELGSCTHSRACIYYLTRSTKSDDSMRTSVA